MDKQDLITMGTPEPQPVHVRPATPRDAERVAAMAHWCSRRTISLRFMGGVSESAAIDELEREVRAAAPLGEAFVAETGAGELIGEAYAARSGPDEAEVAFVVADRWQHHGVGTALFAALLERMRAEHIHAVWAETSSDNLPMLLLLRDTGLASREEHDGGTVRIHLQLADVAFASPISLNVNGRTVTVPAADAERPLLWLLRDRLGLRGPKFGCGHGGCGACTVQVGGRAVASCTLRVADVVDERVLTVEGLDPADPVFRAWLAEQVPQCGYCQPAMVMTASALLTRSPHPTDAEIDEAFAGVMCRCGTYQRVRRAVHRAAAQRWDDAPFPADPLSAAREPVAQPLVRFNPFVALAPDGTVLVTIGRSEMGQGINTTLASLVAEELDVPMDAVRTEFAPVDHAFDDPTIGMQITVGSLSVKNMWFPMRRAAAEVRERLIATAATRWDVAPATCRAHNGAVVHSPTARHLTYAELAADAVKLPPPGEPPLREPETFRILGRPTARLEIPDHVGGRTVFGTDITLPGMLTATVAMPPAFGAEPVEVDGAAAKRVPGVRDVLKVSSGIAVVAEDAWSAIRGREALHVIWSGGTNPTLSSAQIEHRLLAALDRRGSVERSDGDLQQAFDGSKAVHESTYLTPYLAHVPIEVPNATARLGKNECELWIPTQGQTLARAAAAKAAGLAPEAVTVHTTFLGGGFGRRAVPDVAGQAVEIARAVGAPVQVLWTREDDLQHDRYRPASAVWIRGGIDADGHLTAWSQRVAGPKLALEGIDVPYGIDAVRIEAIEDDPGVPTGYWRSVGASQNAFAVESFVDELAYAAGIDPVAFRLRALTGAPRYRHVLELAAERAGWGKASPPCDGRGVAVCYAHGGWVAQVAEIDIKPDGTIAVRRVVCAVDCGFPVNPDGIAAQIEGAIAFGLTAALKASITIAGGGVEQHDLHDYPLLTLAEMPRVEVHIVPSREDPSGAGECGLPPIAPAVANAIFAATGQRLHRLPLHLGA